MAEIIEKEVGSFEAKNRLSALIDEASRGSRIWITRHGKRVALLTSGTASVDSSKSSLVEQFRKIRSRSKSDGSSLKELVEEGRR
jgi:prevent-host-death family protein